MAFGPFSRRPRKGNQGGCSGKGAAVSRQEFGVNNAAEQAPKMDGWCEWMEGWMGPRNRIWSFRSFLDEREFEPTKVRDDDRQCRGGVEV
jgi:hypothetical protein